MIPTSVGTPSKDWVQLGIGVIWATVIGIMLLAKMKVIQDVFILSCLILGAAVQNAEVLLPGIWQNPKLKSNLSALRVHLQKESAWCGTIMFIALNMDWMFRYIAPELTLVLSHAVLYHVLAFVVYWITQPHSQHHFSSATTLAVSAATPRKLTDIQVHLFLIYQTCGIGVALLLYGAIRSQYSDDFFDYGFIHLVSFGSKFCVSGLAFHRIAMMCLGKNTKKMT